MMTMTSNAKSHYLSAASTPNLCPQCDSDQIVGKVVEIEGKEAHQPCYCDDCNTEWTDTYTLSDVTITKGIQHVE